MMSQASGSCDTTAYEHALHTQYTSRLISGVSDDHDSVSMPRRMAHTATRSVTVRH